MILNPEDFKQDMMAAYKIGGDRYADFVARYWNNLPRYVCENWRHTPTWQQMDLMEAVTVPGCRVACASGHGCFGKGTGVRMFDGSVKAVEDVVEGDFVMGEDRTHREVVELARGREEMYRFHYTNGFSRVYNHNHVLCLYNHETNQKESMKVGEYIAFGNVKQLSEYRTPLPFHVIDPLQCYWVEPLGEDEYYGFSLAGGNLFLGEDDTVLSNTGKSDLAAWILDWHLRVFPKSNSILTANLLDQCRQIIWKYLDGVIEDMAKAWPWQQDWFIKETKSYFAKGYKDSWYCTPKTAPDAKPENLAGQHNRNLLFICDEASAISDAKHGVMRGALTEEANRYVMFSQPTRSVGHFAEAFGPLRYDPVTKIGIYVCFNLNSEESPRVSKQFIQEKLLEYNGHHSPEYQIKVLGRLPDNLAGYLIPRPWLEDAQKVTIEHKEAWGWVVTVDVAEGVHRDSSVYAVWKVSGYGDQRYAECVKQVETLDHDELRFARDLYADIQDMNMPNVTIAVDADGPGRTVILTLEDLGLNCQRIHWGLPCHMDADKKRYKNQRAFSSVKTREAIFNQGKPSRIKLPPGKKIVEQGSKIPYKIDEAGRYVITPKDQMKNDGIKSPDLFDTVCFVQLADYVPCSMEASVEQNELMELAKKMLELGV